VTTIGPSSMTEATILETNVKVDIG